MEQRVPTARRESASSVGVCVNARFTTVNRAEPSHKHESGRRNANAAAVSSRRPPARNRPTERSHPARLCGLLRLTLRKQTGMSVNGSKLIISN